VAFHHHTLVLKIQSQHHPDPWASSAKTGPHNQQPFESRLGSPGGHRPETGSSKCSSKYFPASLGVPRTRPTISPQALRGDHEYRGECGGSGIQTPAFPEPPRSFGQCDLDPRQTTLAFGANYTYTQLNTSTSAREPEPFATDDFSR